MRGENLQRILRVYFFLDAESPIPQSSDLASRVQPAEPRSLVSPSAAVIAYAASNRIIIAAETDKSFGFPRKTTEQRF